LGFRRGVERRRDRVGGGRGGVVADIENVVEVGAKGSDLHRNAYYLYKRVGVERTLAILVHGLANITSHIPLSYTSLLCEYRRDISLSGP
jgi:hypothetical protein